MGPYCPQLEVLGYLQLAEQEFDCGQSQAANLRAACKWLAAEDATGRGGKSGIIDAGANSSCATPTAGIQAPSDCVRGSPDLGNGSARSARRGSHIGIDRQSGPCGKRCTIAVG